MEFKEDIQIELKEFFIKHRKELKAEEYEEAILSGKMYPNSQILHSLESDFSKYIGKYLSGWNHKDLDIDAGKIYFGVKDNGDISGIPFNGKLTHNIISNMIFNCAKTIKGDNIKTILNSIKIEIIPIKPTNNNVLKEYYNQRGKYYRSLEKHKKSVKVYLEWHKKMRSWHCKLIDYLNVPAKRSEFLKWVKTNCDSSNKQEIINEINDWKVKKKFSVIIGDEKKDPSKLVYWLCIFKDLATAKKRPKPSISPIYQCKWSKIYHSPFWMNYKISQMNPKVRFYLIKLTIPNLKIPIYTKYKDKWIQYRRINSKLGPSSIPL